MAVIKLKDIVEVIRNDKRFVRVYKGLQLIWEIPGYILSCFGKGYWIKEKPWLNEDSWKNNV